MFLCSWAPSWDQVQKRKAAGKVEEVTVSTRELEEIVNNRETDRRYAIVYDDIGDAHIIKLHTGTNKWILYKGANQ